MIKYLGSKRLLAPLVAELLAALPGARTVVEPFSGTARVGHALKARGLRVLASDHNAYAARLARCYVAADRDELAGPAERLLAELRLVPPRAGWFTETYAVESRFFQPANAARIEAVREAIAARDLPPELEAVALVALMEAADRVDSTTGLQMAYLKSWAPRSYRELELRLPRLLPRAAAGKGEAHELDAFDAVEQLEGDVAYLDPPYNQHRYRSNYHVWETLVRWDRPEVYGVARKRSDCRTQPSPFNGRRTIEAAVRQVVERARARSLVVSFSNEGWIDRATMERLLSARGHVTVLEQDFKRYVGAQIGIHNPRGERVGQVSHLRNLEYLFVVTEAPLPAGWLDEVRRRATAPAASSPEPRGVAIP